MPIIRNSRLSRAELPIRIISSILGGILILSTLIGMAFFLFYVLVGFSAEGMFKILHLLIIPILLCGAFGIFLILPPRIFKRKKALRIVFYTFSFLYAALIIFLVLERLRNGYQSLILDLVLPLLSIIVVSLHILLIHKESEQGADGDAEEGV